MKQIHNEFETVTDIKEQIAQAMSNSEQSHFLHIESQTLISFSDADEAADEYNDQIEASPEEYLQVVADNNVSEAVLAQKFAEHQHLASDLAAYREQFYGKMAESWLTENGLTS